MDALPHEVLVMVLQRLTLRDRLSSALVQRCWAVAAAAATSSIKLHCTSGQEEWYVQQLQQPLPAWLQKHGRHLTSLDLQGDESGPEFSTMLPQLPCPQLLELQVRDMLLRLVPGRPSRHCQHPGVLSACTGLRVLRLDECGLQQPRSDLAALAAASSLRSLAVGRLFVSTGSPELLLSESFVFQLTQLTNLEWSGTMQAQAVEQLGHLTGLQSLSLDFMFTREAITLDALSQLQQLTSLCLRQSQWAAVSLPLGLTSLRFLRLKYFDHFDLATLAGLVALQDLGFQTGYGAAGSQVVTATLKAGLPALQHLRLDVAVEAPVEEQALLAWLGARTNLRHLELGLDKLLLDDIPEVPAAYSALTASSQLTCLDLTGHVRPVGICKQLFPEGRLLPELAVLNVNLCRFEENDAVRLIRSCPALQALRLCRHKWHCRDRPDRVMLSKEAALVVLQGLPQLQTLVIGDISSVAATRELAKLTGLTHLETGEVTPAVCQELTALRKLHHFKAKELQDGAEPSNKPSWITLDFQAPVGSAPDVWRQLQRRFDPGHSRAQP